MEGDKQENNKYTVALSSTQTQELNSALAEYLKRNGHQRSFEIFVDETGAKVKSDVQHVGLLEKKWAMTLRLQQRIINLEKRIQELEGGALLSHRHKDLKSSASWIPRQPEKLTLYGHRDSVMRVVFHPVYSVLLSCSEDHTIKIWDLETGEVERSFKAHLSTIQDVCFSADGTRFASCSADASIKIWQFGESYECLRTLRGHSHTVSSVSFLPNKPFILSASRDATVKLWDLTSGFCTQTYTEHAEWVRRVTVNEDGTLFATCSNDKSIIVWCLNTHKPVSKLYGHSHVIECVLFVPSQHANKIVNGQKHTAAGQKPTLIVSGGRDRVIKVWDVFAGVCLVDLEGHDNWIRDIVLHPSGGYLISVADDKSIRIWSIEKEETQRCRVIQNAHDHFIYSVDFHKKLPYVATSCTDSSIRLWECR